MRLTSMLKWLFCSIVAMFLSNTDAQSTDTVSNADNPVNSAAGYFLSVSAFPIYAGSINIGYHFTRNLGIQAGVLSIWETALGLDVDTATIYDVAMRGAVPLGDHGEIFGKLGVGIIDGQVQVSLPLFGTIKQSGSSIGPTFGLGLGYYFTRHWTGTLEYSGIYSVGSQVLKNGVKGVPMIGVTYHFVG